ncbi:MAG TPA: DUF559 domain-containing protein [Sphingobacteriaceae bacterium]|nr:DUF559 domain-containing protein [Sphingobacteriaceae bacterium]
MDFHRAHQEFLAFHESVRRGERLRRLQMGHGHAERLFLEQVWWPAFQSFRNLHPEYEVLDFDDQPRYLDFAYLKEGTKLAIEIDGFGPHVRDLNRRQFIRHLRRQNHLVLDGWSVLRFSYDEVKEQPRRCQQVLQQFMGRQSWGDGDSVLNFRERAIVQLALGSRRPITPADICGYMGVSRNVAYKLLHSLVRQGWLVPAAGQQRIRSYRLAPQRFFV